MPIDKAAFPEIRILGHDDQPLGAGVLPDLLIVGTKQIRRSYVRARREFGSESCRKPGTEILVE
jgi:hypothetical protein